MVLKRKKILFVITKGNFGGAQRYVFDLATNLPKDQFEVKVVCGEGEELPDQLQEAGIEVIKISSLAREIKTTNEFRVCKELISILRKEKPDILHLNSSKIGGLGSVAGRIASTLEKDYKSKIIFTAHNWGFNDIGRSFSAKLFFYLSHWVTILLCDHVICVAQKIKQDVSWMPFVKEKLRVVHNGLASFKTIGKKEAMLFLIGEETKKTIIFSIAELHPNKGLDVALRAITLLPTEYRQKIIYCIIGSGEEELNLKNMAQNMGILEQVRFLGLVLDAKKYLEGANIFLLPSRNEAFPYVILEAGFVNLPIIATSVGGIPEVVKDMRSGILVHPRNPREIAEAILYMLDHKDKRKEFAAEMKKEITNSFSFEKMLSETLKIYELKISRSLQ